MQIRIQGSGVVDLPGVGLVETGKWIDVTPEQEALFEVLHEYTLRESTIEWREEPPPEPKPLIKPKPPKIAEPEPEEVIP